MADRYANDSHGVYIPQYFAESVKRDCVSGVSDEDWKILEAGPHDNDQYWEAWDEVLSRAKLTDPTNGKEGHLWQDGDL
jgi:hypothetical protein